MMGKQPIILISLLGLCFGQKKNIGFNLAPMGIDGFGKDYRETSVRFFADVFKHSTSFRENTCCGDDTGAQLSSFFTSGAQNGQWLSYGIPPSHQVQWRDDGYPMNLDRWSTSAQQENRISAVAHIGKGAAFVRSGIYACRFDGDGDVDFEKDGAVLSKNRSLILVNVTANQGIRVRITRTNSSNPLHNLTLYPIELFNRSFPESPFHPDFITEIRGATMLRFTGWLRVDSNDYNPYNSPRNWANRTLPTYQTQNCLAGVALEHMIELANLLGAAPWFSMPKAADPNDAYITQFSASVRDRLDPGLSAYVEYRDQGAGALSTEQSQQSLIIFAIWKRVFGNQAERVRRVATLKLGYSLQGFGADLDQVDAIATPAYFGNTMCPAQQCSGLDDFNSLRGPFTHAERSVDELLDVLRSLSLAAEYGWNQVANVARAGKANREVLASTFGVYAQAMAYAWRTTWMGAFGSGGCQSCLWAQMAVKFGPDGLLRRAGSDGWLRQESWNCTVPGAVFRAANRSVGVSAGQYMAGSAAECKAACAAAAAARGAAGCGGFTHDESKQICFFVANVSALGVPAVSLASNSPNLGTLGNGSIAASCYSQRIPQPAVTLADAWAACRGRCSAPPFYAVPPLTAADLDALAAMEPNITRGAVLEQLLDDKLLAANSHPRMRGIFMDALERWSRVAGGGGACMPPLDFRPGTWTFAVGWTKGVDLADVGLRRGATLSPAPKLEAVRSWIAGEPLLLPFTAVLEDAGVGLEPPPCSGGCVWGVCVGGECRCFVGYQGPACDIASPTNRPPNECQSAGSPVGVNLAGMSYWSTEWDYVDVFKKSGLGDSSGNRGWIAQNFVDSVWDTGQLLNMSASGYPAELAGNQKAGRLMVRDLARHGQSGVYTVLYDGDGVLGFSMDAVRVWRPRPGRVEVLVTLSAQMNNGLFVVIERTNPLDPVRNIRVLAPGFGAGGAGWGGFEGTPFHPAFVQTLWRYRVLRFMDWQNTNGVPPGDWASRPQRSTPSYTDAGGVPLEDMILLANVVGADMWLCIPHLADDNYVRRFAEMVAAKLRPDRRVFVEFSNEVWHTGFPGGQYADARGVATGLRRFCWTVARMRNVSRTFQAALGAGQRGRLVVVLSSQVSNADATQQLLACDVGLPGQDIDAIALAPYFDGFSTTIKDVGSMIAAYDRGINESVRLVRQHAALTRARGFALLTYEAGPGSAVGSFNDLGIATHRDPRMRGLVRRYYLGLAAEGVSLLLHFSFVGQATRYGAWGLMEATDQDPDTVPKLLGLNDVIDTFAVCPLPNASRTDGGRCLGRGYYTGGRGGGTGCFCYYGFSGASCEQAQYTEHLGSCGYYCTFDQGICEPTTIDGAERYWGCRCGLGYFGVSCSRFTCASPCMHGGTCIDQDVCSCFPGFRGPRCEIDCGCNGHGACARDNSTCVCDAGWLLGPSGTCEWDCDCPDGAPCAGPGVCGCSPSCARGTCLRGQCLCWAGFSGAACDEPVARPNDGSPIGMNLAGVTYGMEWIYVDVMKHASEWVSVPSQDTGNTSAQQYIWGDGQPILEDPNGFPTRVGPVQEIVALTLRDVCRHATPGRYVALYDGDGLLDFGMDSTVMARRRGRVDLAYTPTCKPSCWFDQPGWQAYCTDNGIYIRILQTNPSNPIRNIRIIAPGFLHRYEAMPFNPYYLKSLERYSLLRFMGMQNINEADSQVHWDDRPIPQRRTFHGRPGGVPIEHMILLANLLGADPWFCMPHAADDDYVRRFAEAALAGLREDVTVHIEYSNEVWNMLFSQAAYAQKQGEALNLTKIGRPCITSTSLCPRYRYHSRRSRQIFQIWATVFGPARRHRLKFVMSTWTISTQTSREILMFEDAYKWTDLLAITGYLGPTSVINAAWSIKSISQVFDELYAGIASTERDVRAQAAVAAEFNVSLTAYEAGPSLVEDGVIGGGGATGTVTTLLIAASRDPRMQTFYEEALRRLRAAGLFDDKRPLAVFISSGPFSKYGEWAHLEYTRQPPEKAPKYRALQRTIENATSSKKFPTGCFDPRYGPWGMGDNAFLGPPAVLSPATGDKWITGQAYELVWDAMDAPAGSTVVLTLWRKASCQGLGGGQVAVLSAGTLDDGRFWFEVPASLPTRDDYFVRVEKLSVIYYSEAFSITQGFEYAVGQWGGCSAACGYGLARREVSCRTVREASRELELGASIEVDASSASCLDDSKQLPTRVYNQWLNRWEVTWVNGTLASNWDVTPDFQIIVCNRLTTGCVEYRTARYDKNLRPPPYLHGNFKNVLDCTASSAADPPRSPLVANLAADSCAAQGLLPPPAESRCFVRPCTAAGYVTGEWGACSSACGGGMRNRSVACMGGDGQPVVWEVCAGAGAGFPPAVWEECNGFPCPSYRWEVLGDWSACSATCGAGIRWRPLACISTTTQAVSNPSLCSGADRPSSAEACQAPRACATAAAGPTGPWWEAGPWGTCNASCGGGSRVRRVACHDPEAGGSETNAARCTGAGTRPADEEACAAWPCETFAWAVGPWGPCNVSCGGGVAYRTVLCRRWPPGPPTPAGACGGAPPTDHQVCGATQCDSCLANPACSGHGTCAGGGRCACEDGWAGEDCGRRFACEDAAPVDRSGQCCAVGSVRDRTGRCCEPPARLDTCGVCGGGGRTIDATGACCDGVLDSAGLCCAATRALDACGVCGGAGDTCGVAVGLTFLTNISLVGVDFSDVRAEYMNMLRAWLSRVGNVTKDQVIFQTLHTLSPAAAASASAGRRLLELGNSSAVVVSFVVTPSLLSDSASGSVSVLQAMSDLESRLANASTAEMGSNGNGVLSLELATSGVCGNGVCEQGERCDDFGSGGCCAADCPFTLQSCPAPPGSSLPCGGTGRCLPGSGACDCFFGYAGVACETPIFALAMVGQDTNGGECVSPPPWEQVVAWKVMGKTLNTGGLGKLADDSFHVWACLDPTLMPSCAAAAAAAAAANVGGASVGSACYRYNEGKAAFEWWGWGSELGLP